MQIAKIIINKRALKHNLQRLRQLAPSSKLIAIVKANAYGHGLLETALTLKNADGFGVARIEEAIILYNGGIRQPILLLEGFFDSKELFIISELNFHTIVHNEEQLYAIEKIKLNKPITVWMKLDTGMHRLGILPEIGDSFYNRLSKCKNIKQPVNIISHFTHANELESKITKKQLDKFNLFCKSKPGIRSIAASSGILLWKESHLDLVRPGIILYGISPLKGKLWAHDFGFQPVMTLTSSLITVRSHKAGEPVGYSAKWISKYDTTIGIIALGYGDGYPHAAPSGTPVLINGREVPLVGSVTMDMICVDLGNQKLDKVGDQVILWGDSLPVERISQITGISSYELITRLTSRMSISFLE